MVRLEREAPGAGLGRSGKSGPPWGLAAAAYSYLVTVATATLVIARNRAAVEIEPRVDQVLLWQAASYGLWIPVAATAWLIFERNAPGRRLIAFLSVLGFGAVFGHAIGAAALENVFSVSSRASLLASAATRIPVDLLVYTAICTAAWGFSEHGRARDLAAALSAARVAASNAQEKPVLEQTARILVSTGSRYQSVATDSIEWIGAAANYAVIHWEGREGLVRETLNALEQRLNPDMFVRIHRSSIANLSMVESASSLSDGSWRLTMKSGDELVVSRTYRNEILARLGRRSV